MEKNISLQKLKVNKKIKKIYTSFKENNLYLSFLLKFFQIFEIFDKIIIIDIIFQFKRKFINLYFPLYFISPTFYFETLNSKYGNNSDVNVLDNTYIEKDQIYRIHSKYLKIKPIHQLNFLNYRIFSVCFLIMLIILFLIHFIKYNNYVLNLCKKISVILIYFIFIALIIPFLIIFNRTIIMQFSEDYNELKTDFILDVILLLIFNYITYEYYMLFIYAFDENEKYFYLKSNYFLIQFLKKELSVILIVLRIKNY